MYTIPGRSYKLRMAPRNSPFFHTHFGQGGGGSPGYPSALLLLHYCGTTNCGTLLASSRKETCIRVCIRCCVHDNTLLLLSFLLPSDNTLSEDTTNINKTKLCGEYSYNDVGTRCSAILGQVLPYSHTSCVYCVLSSDPSGWRWLWWSVL